MTLPFTKAHGAGNDFLRQQGLAPGGNMLVIAVKKRPIQVKQDCRRGRPFESLGILPLYSFSQRLFVRHFIGDGLGGA